MSLPCGNPDTTFESFLQELPADYRELAFEFKAFTPVARSKPRSSCSWNLDRWAAGLTVMRERPRRRPLQTLPERVSRLIAQCRVLGMTGA
jgi:hypothetical protein